MQKLELNGLQELNQEELANIDGGGWLADAVAATVHYMKCACHSPSGDYHDAMKSANHGGIR
jgi:lactobin A/cerein 7B family class IIb bacteriocin